MALFEDVFKGAGLPGIAVGIGAVLLAPVVLPAIGRAVRPVAKAVIKTGITTYREAAHQLGNVTGPLMDEARAEMAAKE